MATSFGHNGHH